jgi:FMN phosphatase YigB (HAD superfamily)
MMSEKKYVVCDLDGTLCNHRHRVHLAWLGKWNEYNAASCYDDVIEETQRFLYELSVLNGKDIIFLTGRSVDFTTTTRQWLNTKGFTSFHLIMRQNNDYRQAQDFKKYSLLEWGTKNDVLMSQIDYAIDDDERCIAMFKELNIKKVIHYK